MKKRLTKYSIVLFLIMVMQSCIVEHYSKPDKIYFAYELFENSKDSRIDGARKTDIALKADVWLRAETQEARDSISVLHFMNLELSLKSDTLYIGNYCKIITSGKLLQDAGTTWELFGDSDNIPFETTITNESGLLHTKGKGLGFYYNEIAYDLYFQNKGKRYEVTGTGSSSTSELGLVTYTIKDPLEMKFPKESISILPYWPAGISVESGSLDLLWHEIPESSEVVPVFVEYLLDFRIEVTAFGDKRMFTIL